MCVCVCVGWCVRARIAYKRASGLKLCFNSRLCLFETVSHFVFKESREAQLRDCVCICVLTCVGRN